MGDRLSRRLWLLQSEALLTEARRRTGLEDFGNPPIEPALSILVKSLELEADLHPLGWFLMRVHLREQLETRLRLAQAWSGRLEALEASLIQGLKHVAVPQIPLDPLQIFEHARAQLVLIAAPHDLGPTGAIDG